MVQIGAKVKTRLVEGIKKFQPVLTKAKDRDINESDTVTIIADMLDSIFGYDKYSEITSEYVIKKTYCDLAVEIDGKIVLLLEAKAAGLALKDEYVKQAVDYGANEGVDWVVLTNGVLWRIYKVGFTKPISKELIYEFNFLELSAKKQSDLEMLFYLCRESTSKQSNNLLNDYAMQKQVMNHFFVGQLLLTEPILNAIRLQMRKISPETKPTNDEILDILKNNVIKRDALEGEKSADAKARITKYERAVAREKAKSAATKQTLEAAEQE